MQFSSAGGPVLEGELISREVWSARERRAVQNEFRQLLLLRLAHRLGFLAVVLVLELEALHARLREIGHAMAQLREDAGEVRRRLDRIVLMLEAIAHHLGVQIDTGPPQVR